MLNRAHLLHRQAEKQARKGNIEEAIKLHREAADILRELLQTVINEKVQESIRLQAELYEKEQLVLKNQRSRAIKVYKNIEKIRVKMNDDDDQMSTYTLGSASPMTSRGRQSNNGNVNPAGLDYNNTYFQRQQKSPSVSGTPGRSASLLEDSLQVSIYRKLEETESLLDQLRVQDDSAEQWRGGTVLGSSVSTPRRHLQTFSATPPTPTHQMSDINSATKRPKDDKVIIEELQIANSHLRRMVDSLFLELSTFQRENRELKQRVRHLEGQLREQQQEAGDDVTGSGDNDTASTQTTHLVHTCGRQRSGRSSSAGRRSTLGSVSSLVQPLPPAVDLPALDMPVFDFQARN